MPKIVWNHKCKKCGGQCYLEQTEDGDYMVCLQCGYTEKLKALTGPQVAATFSLNRL